MPAAFFQGGVVISVTRRRFLQAAVVAALPFGRGAAAPIRTDPLRVAVLGVNGRGRVHVANFAGRHGCIIDTLCDVDEDIIAPAMRAAEEAQGKLPRFQRDLRRVLDDRTIDIVTIATPNHWHALAAIWAMQAGKDVYLEKPVSHDVAEGRCLVRAVRRTGRVCQAGLQCRSHPGMQKAMAYVRSGKLGRVQLVRGLCYKWRPPIGRVHEEPQARSSLDYNLWCGPGPLRPPHRKRLHYDWHWQWDYGNGELGNQGVHQLDIARWGLGKNAPPRAVMTIGGRFGPSDDGESPNTEITLYDYGDCQLIFEVRGFFSPPYQDTKIGTIFYGSEGTLVCPSYSGGFVLDPAGNTIERFDGSGDHYGNFIEAVRRRRPDSLAASIEEGHQSTLLCHLGNISYRLGTTVPLGRIPAGLADAKAVEAFGRMREHLKTAAAIDDQAPCRFGPRLEFDAERFVNHPAADALLSRPGRAPFTLPPS
jgi:predicted dehydrogenase